jgi:lysophospholipase L1-like esterase
MKMVLIGVSVLLFGCALWFLFFQKNDVANYPPKNSTIVAFGDSLVEGVGAREGNDLMSQLERRIGRPIINLGVSGNTTADGVQRLDVVTALDPGLVIVVLGGNDTVRRVPIEITEAHLRTIFETLIKQGAVVVFLGVRGGIFGNERETMYERVATEYGVVYVSDILDGILLKPERMYDGIHPNDVGYGIIAERVAHVFEAYSL